MTDWAVWKAGEADIDALVRLEAASFGDRSWGAASLQDSFSAAGVEVLFTGEAGAPPTGFAIWRCVGDEAELLSIGVDPSKLRRGAAQALLRAVELNARKKEVQKLFLEVDRQNEAASAFYTGADYKTVGERAAYYRGGGDAIIMKKQL